MRFFQAVLVLSALAIQPLAYPSEVVSDDTALSSMSMTTIHVAKSVFLPVNPDSGFAEFSGRRAECLIKSNKTSDFVEFVAGQDYSATYSKVRRSDILPSKGGRALQMVIEQGSEYLWVICRKHFLWGLSNGEPEILTVGDFRQALDWALWFER